MAPIAHKYMAQEISDEERERTFVAREGVLDLLVRRLRASIGTGSFPSFLLVGPRGSGKTTLVNMVRQRIAADPPLTAAFLPVILPEEQIAAASLRDLLVLVLEVMTHNKVSGARDAYDRCDVEKDERTSEAIAIECLSRISRDQRKTLLIAIENLDELFASVIAEEREQATLRRLLTHEPFLCLLATATSLFTGGLDYEHSFFGHFERISLDPLTRKQADALLTQRALFDGQRIFRERIAQSRDVVHTFTRLTGGNPRLLLMLYEVVTAGNVGSTVVILRKLVDELTPLYNGKLAALAPQSRKVLDALMRRGGTATPAAIAEISRLPLNKVTAHLTRLRKDGWISLRRGGKGRDAYYSPADQFFGTWYKLRYIGAQRRMVDLIVEVFRAWFTIEQRGAEIERLIDRALRSRAEKFDRDRGDHLLASLERTPIYNASAQQWQQALSRYEEPHILPTSHARAQSNLETRRASDIQSTATIDGDTGAIDRSDASPEQRARALVNRGTTHRQAGRTEAAIEDFSRVIDMPDAPPEQRARALVNRGITHRQAGRTEAAIEDYSRVIDMPDARPEQRARALVNRGVAHGQAGRTEAEIEDYSRVIDMPDAPPEQRALALFNRGVTHGEAGRTDAEIEDYSRVIDMVDAPIGDRRDSLQAIVLTQVHAGDATGAIAILADKIGTYPELIGDAQAAVALLHALAQRESRPAWPQLFEVLVGNAPSDVRGHLETLRPVADHIDGRHPVAIDALPPEQRTLVEEVLRAFEPADAGV
ncbi:MAG TPA: tetratricopeptide repeat protein [Vineibacter sp.]|nr:tetratricopeptide repeat protein [Vineibacter sp.]